jgi:hypothetical protein
VTVSVNVMNTKDVGMRVKSTSVARINHSSGKHGFSNRAKYGFPGGFYFLVCAFTGAVFAVVSQMPHKLLSTVSAVISCLSFHGTGFVIAFSRTVFSFCSSRVYMGKDSPTDSARFSVFTSNVQSTAGSRTVFGRILPVLLNFKDYITIKARDIYLRGLLHAIKTR